MADGIYAATCAFSCIVEGVDYSVSRGTTVRSGHPLLVGREELFTDFEVDYEYEAPEPAGKHAAPAAVPVTPKLSVKGASS